MTTKAHKLLTGADLHEPKGVATALAGQVYISDGAGSGVWTTISTNIQFSTGDVKLTMKTTPDTGWLMWNDGSVGSAASGATYAATVYQALFELMWNNVPVAWTIVSGGRGGSSAADWAANKRITMPQALGRAMAVAGVGVGLTSRQLGQALGTENHTLSAAEIPPITSSNTGSIGVAVTSTTANTATGVIQSANVTGGADRAFTSSGANVVIASSGTLAIGAVNVSSNNTGAGTHNNMPPSIYFNVMVKY